jgi:hypothetical protein
LSHRGRIAMHPLNSRTRILLIAIVYSAAAGAPMATAELNDRLGPSPDDPAIQYRTGTLADPVSVLIAKLQSGNARLRFAGPQGYLRSLIDALNIPIESQIAVFSKTSLQTDRIEPRNPRTIFFNDSVSVAWMFGGFIELASHDPQRGMIFYTLPQDPSGPPEFQRRYDCLRCHFSDQSLGVPGMMIRSMFTAPDGRPLLIFGGSSEVDHRTPVAERWGGYYVTGVIGALRHLGNAMFTDEDENNPQSVVNATTLKLASLESKFDIGNYLSPYSDVGALLVFDHQMHMHNLITRVGWEARAAQYKAQHSQSVDAARLLREAAEEFVDYLLFIDEAPFGSPGKPTSAFARKFAAQGPRDRQGRSLRDLDFKSRLLRYPCSYMIYSEAFDALPGEAKDAIYKRMWQVLSGGVQDKKYAHLGLTDRRAIVEILRDTKKDLPGYFQPLS